MAVTLRYFTEFGKPVFQHINVSICGGIYVRVYCVYDVVRKEVHVRYLEHLLMSFLFSLTTLW